VKSKHNFAVMMALLLLAFVGGVIFTSAIAPQALACDAGACSQLVSSCPPGSPYAPDPCYVIWSAGGWGPCCGHVIGYDCYICNE
jgi:hypothetical protein